MTASMVANLLQRDYSVAIGGKDFSPGVGLCQLTQDKQTSAGYVTVRGSLEICDWLGLDESLDPHLNLVRWQVGQTVEIRVADSTGTLQPLPFGMLYVLGGTPSGDYRRLELEIGDWLALEEWRSTESPDEADNIPVSGDQAIASFSRQSLMTDLLGRVEMSFAGAIAGDWVGDRVEDLQGSYIELAGGVAFGAESPGILWGYGKSGRLTVIDPAPAAPWLQVTLGQDEALYEPQSAEFPVEIYICTADGYGSGGGELEPGDPGCVVRSFLDSTADETSTYCVDTGSRTVIEGYRLKEPEVSLDPDGGTGLVQSLDRDSTKLYGAQDDRLYTITTRIRRPKIAILNEASKEQGVAITDPWLDITAEREITTYTYDDDLGVVSAIVWEKELTLGELAPKYADPVNWSTRTTAERRVEEWYKNPAGEWLYQRREYQSRILASPQLVEKLDEEGGYDMVAIATNLVVVPQGGLSGSTAGQTQPPGIEYFPDSTDGGFQPETLEGRATFVPLPGALRKSRETEEAIPLASTVDALQAAANIGGVFRLGRYRGRSLKIPIPDKFFTSYEPLRRVDVVETAAVKTYLTDGMVLLLDRTESSLFFPHLIWLGSAATQGITGISGSSENILQVPTPENFEVGQSVQFAPVPGGALPAGLVPDVPYFVVSTSGGLQVSESLGGSPVTIGALPAVSPTIVLPSPDPVTGALGVPEPAYGGAPFVVLPTSENSDPRVPSPIVPPYQTTTPGFAEIVAGVVAGQDLSARRAVAIAPSGGVVGQSLETRKGGGTAENGVRIGQQIGSRYARAIAGGGVVVGISIRSGGPGLATVGAIAGQSFATRKSRIAADNGVLVGEFAFARQSGAIATGGVGAGESLSTRPSGFGVSTGVRVGQDIVGRSQGLDLGQLLFMAHGRGRSLSATDARRVGIQAKSLVHGVSVLGKGCQ